MLLLLLAVLLFVQLPEVDCGPIREAEGALQKDWFSRVVHYMDSNPETLEELMTRDHAVLEGDIVLSSDRNAAENIWPTLEIPYTISWELASRTGDILSAMAMVSEQTCVSFHKRTSETNYLFFKPSKGCASYVGFISGEQPIFVAPQCIVGNIAHEILHALGFHHEHTRTDREQYITVLPHNIMTGMERNFKMQSGQTFDLHYDIGSIMHYGSEFFSANGLPTIISKSDVKDMGQRNKMTATDIEKVRHLYNCGGTKKELKTEISGVEEVEEVEEEEEDAVLHLIHDVVSDLKTIIEGSVSTNKPEEDHTPATAPPPASLLHLDAATRGQNNTS
ncbi:astacin-like metalloendopeptidase isoform X2 [Dicentrarchus labrax]|uniref:astacin-like metalloendopeptidase isoform X2 n=1 Tax=Dicentrarchus labrax TaxID=13489 RepID=UPI0021F66F40|nr:astacin-like metalloendopeptidase isoform X2 [Dicentrarchus labrax]